MARVKKTVWQRNMSAMEVRRDLLEADGTEMKGRSLRKARNMRARSTGVVEARPGTLFIRNAPVARQLIEIMPGDGEVFALALYDDRLRMLNENGVSVFDVVPVPWSTAERLWVVPIREKIIIGDSMTGLHLLEYRSGSWAFGAFAFEEGEGNSLLQPYWNFQPGSRINVSAASGTVTVTSPSNVFSSQHVGQRIRYLGREIAITAFANAGSVTGTVISRLPPSFDLTVGSTANIRLNDVVNQETSGFQGIVTAVPSGTRIKVVTLDNFEGPLTGADERLSFPSGTTAITGKDGIPPEPTRVWDEPMMSPLRNWPRSGAAVAGRLVLVDFPRIPNAVALSAAGRIGDFGVGVEDDDAIIRTIGDDAPRLRHAINMGDLLIFAERGSYVVNLPENQGLTPSNFQAKRFDSRGCNRVRPVRVDDAALFVEARGETVLAAMLDGSANLRWAVRDLTTFHHELISSPVALCGPGASSIGPEKYAFVVNENGTLAAISWVEGLGAEGIGFAPWDTAGTFRHIAPAFGHYWTIVDRTIANVPGRRIERFGDAIHVDCAVRGLPSTPGLSNHLVGQEVAVCWNGRDVGDAVVAGNGSVPGFEHVATEAQIGLNFTAEASPWPVKIVESPRQGTFTARVIRFFVSVQESGTFAIRCNGDTREVGGYAFGDDLSVPAPLRTTVVRAPVFGRREHPDLAVIKGRPGPLRILALGQEVQG